ncbi:LHS1 [Candida margitis]|uniref:LHS1 n=1 Tax=Candida margitis TaxID=1775924 RepID=UPI0022263820|nr:LHS1 [Candida margitis]KAI5953964.1 LHS1 [Candida margitis]
MRFLLTLTCILSSVLSAIVGIDYGQQFTKAVLLAPGIPFELVLTDEGKRKDLSGICIRKEPDGGLERAYGSQMGSLVTRFPQSTVLDLKQLIGKTFDDPATEKYLRTHFGIKLLGDESRNNAIKFDLGLGNSSYQFSVEELLAMSLNEVKARALNDLEENPHAAALVEDVAISIPPFSSQATRQAYLDSLYLANFSNVLGLVDEGTSVALNFAGNKKYDQSEYNDVTEYHLVFDAGAGYTTATLFSITPRSNGKVVLKMESVGEDLLFGGKTLTESVYSIVLEKLLNHFGLESSDLSEKIHARLYEVAEKAKIILSANTEYHSTLESIYGDKDFKVSVTRDEFEEFNSDLMERVTKPIASALKKSGLSVKDLKSVILNGGSTRVPFVQKHVSLFVGEDKISKSVNTDESSALGTTQMGLKLKTKTQNPKDIKLIDRSYHNFEVSTNANDEQLVVFGEESEVGNTTKVNLGEVGDSLSISLFEDGSLIKSYSFGDISNAVQKLGCKSGESKEVIATFELNKSKIFDLVKTNIQCQPKNTGSFLKNLLKNNGVQDVLDVDADEEEGETDEGFNSTSSDTNSTSSDSKAKASKALKSTYVSIPSATYPHVKPIGKDQKKKLLRKLAHLNRLDEAKIELTAVRNELESHLYKLRDLIESNEDALKKELSDKEIAKFVNYVGEQIEWLDFESDGAVIDDLKQKIKDVGGRESEIKSYLDMSNTDLSKDGMKKLYEDGSSLIMTIQSSMLKFGEQIAEVRKKYDNAGLNFDKENDRIKLKLMGKEDKMLSFDRNLREYREVISKIGDLLDFPDSKFNKISKKELYSFHDALAKGVAQMVIDLFELEKTHNDRVKLFDEQYDKLIERQQQKEYRKKLREAAKEAEKKAASENQDDEAAVVEDETRSRSENDAESSSTINEEAPKEANPSSEADNNGADIDHDEL